MFSYQFNFPSIINLKFSASFLTLFLLSVFSFGQNFYISGGHDFSAALCSDGKLLVWGNNDKGQLGPNPGPDHTVPYEIKINSTIRQVDAGSGALGIAVGCTGEVWTWGDIGNGQRGAGATGNPGVAPNQVVGLNGVGTLSNVKYVNASTDCAYAILSNGDLVSWGNNSGGELGTGGTPSSSAVPVYVSTSTGQKLTNAIQVEGGDYGGYALVDADGDGKGTVYSWGQNDSGVLGRDVTSTPANFAGQVIRADNKQPLDNIVSISAGDKHCLALDANGNLWSWGNNGWNGQAGAGTSNDVLYAQKVLGGETGDLYLSNVVSITGGSSFSLAVLADGSVVTWGGIDGAGTTAFVPIKTKTPIFLRDASGNKIKNIQSVSDGDYWAFLISQTGQLFSMGYGPNGELGIAGSTGSKYPLPLNLPTCTAADPCPIANLGEDKIKCPSDVLTLYAGSYSVNYTYIWTVNGVAQAPVLGAAGATFQATDLGTYKVSITSPKVNTCGESCKPAEDEVTITAPTPPPTPTAYYCNGSVFPDYGTLTSKFKWYATAGGTAELGTGPNAASFPSTGLSTTGKDANGDDIYTAYVEDVSGFKGKIGPAIADSGTAGAQVSPVSTASPKQILLTFDALNDFILDSMTLGFGAYSPQGLQTIKININNSSGVLVGSASVLVNNSSGGKSFTKVFLGISIPKGQAYTIDAIGSDKDANIVWFEKASPNWFPKTYTLNGQNVAGNFKNDYGPNYATWSTPAFFDWVVTSPNYYTCGRIPVKMSKKCPLCKKPDKFDFTYTAKTLCAIPASNKIDITVGAVTPATPGGTGTGTFIYQWYKDNVPIAGVAQTQKSISASPGASFASGTYKVRVADKDTTTGSGCYVDSTVTIVFQNPIVQPALTDKDTLCEGTASTKEFGLSSLPTGGVKPYSYQWQSSVGGAAYQNIAGANAQSFKPGSPAQTTYYKRLITGGICGNSLSDSAFIVVDPKISAGAVQAATSPICQFNAPVLTELTPAASTKAGPYNYQWQVDSSFAATPVWKNLAASDAVNLANAPKLSQIGTYNFRRLVVSGKCNASSSSVAVLTVSGMDPGSIQTSQEICFNTSPAALTNLKLAAGGTGATPQYTYVWESSPDGLVYTEIAGASDPASFNPGKVSAITYYKRKAAVTGSTSVCDKGETQSVSVKVFDKLDPGTLRADTGLCAGGQVLNESLTPFSGGSGKKAYQWQQSSNGAAPWADVSGAASENFNTGKLTQTAFYRRVTRDQSCGDTSTGVYKVRIDPVRNPKITTVLPQGTLCELDKNILFTADTTGAGANGIFTWVLNNVEQTQSTAGSIQLSDWVAPQSTIKVTVKPDRTTYACYGPDDVTLITVQVTGKQTPKVALDKINAICEGQSITLTATSAPAFNAATDQLVWKLNGVEVPGFANKMQFSSPTFKDEDVVTVEYTSGSKCAITPNADTSETIKVIEQPVATIKSAAGIICLGDTLPLKASGDFTSANPDTLFQWFINDRAIPGATQSTYHAVKSGSYAVLITNGGMCKDTSPAVPLDVQTPFVDAGPDQNIVNGKTAVLLGTTQGSYTYSISWTPQDSLKTDPSNALHPIVNPSKPTIYTVTVTTPEGCEASDQVKVNVFLPIWIPNAFSPNNDGNNDTWVIDGLDTYPEAEVRVFNRWGNMVFESKGYSEIQRWKGTTTGGSPLPVAVYYYIVDPKNPNGGGVTTGFVTVVR